MAYPQRVAAGHLHSYSRQNVRKDENSCFVDHGLIGMFNVHGGGVHIPKTCLFRVFCAFSTLKPSQTPELSIEMHFELEVKM